MARSVEWLARLHMCLKMVAVVGGCSDAFSLLVCSHIRLRSCYPGCDGVVAVVAHLLFGSELLCSAPVAGCAHICNLGMLSVSSFALLLTASSLLH